MTLEKQLTPTEQQQMVNLEDSSLYINRELSWLEFNHRVLEEVQEPLTPALEKLKFASIFSSNLDEFFMVRVGGLFRVLEAGVDEVDASGRTTRQQLDEIAEKVRGLVTEQYQTIREDLLAQLQKAGILGKSRAGKPQTQAVSTAADPDEKAPLCLRVHGPGLRGCSRSFYRTDGRNPRLSRKAPGHRVHPVLH